MNRDSNGRFAKQTYDFSWLRAHVSVDVYGCWNWSGTITPNGYGRTYINKKNWLAHRLAFNIVHGYVPKVVTHSCDNRKCVNPNHLSHGTQKKNLQDMVDRGRGGTSIFRQVIPDNDREKIRLSDESQSVLARHYGIDQSTVSRIRNMKDTNRTRYGGG